VVADQKLLQSMAVFVLIKAEEWGIEVGNPSPVTIYFSRETFIIPFS
jgi:hypothetical protein